MEDMVKRVQKRPTLLLPELRIFVYWRERIRFSVAREGGIPNDIRSFASSWRDFGFNQIITLSRDANINS